VATPEPVVDARRGCQLGCVLTLASAAVLLLAAYGLWVLVSDLFG